MDDNNLVLGAKIAFKLERYEDGVTQEDIDSGRAQPIETIYTDPTQLTEAEIKALGLNLVRGE
ncbi:MAG: hypothetical protein PHG75_01505 [Syntrophomonas sp.]|nr:hypothetical protein [Syntrophomonas sp.]